MFRMLTRKTIVPSTACAGMYLFDSIQKKNTDNGNVKSYKYFNNGQFRNKFNNFSITNAPLFASSSNSESPIKSLEKYNTKKVDTTSTASKICEKDVYLGELKDGLKVSWNAWKRYRRNFFLNQFGTYDGKYNEDGKKTGMAN